MKASIGTVLSIGVLLVSCTKNTHITNTGVSFTDDYFVTQAAYTNIGFAEAAQFAAQKAQHEPLKVLVNELNTDYQTAYAELKELSHELNYPIPTKANCRHLEEEMALLRLSNEEFDTAYIGRQIRNSLEMIDLLEAQANAGHDLFLKRYAMKYIPVMKMHVYMADSVLSVINNPRHIETDSSEADMTVALGE